MTGQTCEKRYIGLSPDAVGDAYTADATDAAPYDTRSPTSR